MGAPLRFTNLCVPSVASWTLGCRLLKTSSDRCRTISLLLCRLALVHEIVEGCSFRGVRIYLVAIAVDRDSWLADRRKRKRHYRSLCPLFHPGAPVQFCRAYLHKVALSTAGFEKFLLSPLFEMNFY